MEINSKKEYTDKLHKAVCLEYIKTWVKRTEPQVKLFIPDEYEQFTLQVRDCMKPYDKLDVMEFFELIVEIEYKLKQEMQ